MVEGENRLTPPHMHHGMLPHTYKITKIKMQFKKLKKNNNPNVWLIGLWNWFIGRMMPQASDAGHGVQSLLFGLLGFGLAVVQSSLVFPVFSFGLGMLSLCCCLEGFGYRSPRMLSADLMDHFEGTLEAQNADIRGLVYKVSGNHPIQK